MDPVDGAAFGILDRFFDEPLPIGFEHIHLALKGLHSLNCLLHDLVRRRGGWGRNV